MAPASSSPRSGAPAPSHSTAWRPQGSPAYGRLESVAVDQGPPGPSVALVPCAPSPHQRERRAGPTPWMPLARWPLAWPTCTPYSSPATSSCTSSFILSTSSRSIAPFHAPAVAAAPCLADAVAAEVSRAAEVHLLHHPATANIPPLLLDRPTPKPSLVLTVRPQATGGWGRGGPPASSPPP
jgi:hypothetical protein